MRLLNRVVLVPLAIGLVVTGGLVQCGRSGPQNPQKVAQVAGRASSQRDRPRGTAGSRDWYPSRPRPVSLKASLEAIKHMTDILFAPSTSVAPAAPAATNVVEPPAVNQAPGPIQTAAGATGTVNGFPCGGILPPCYVLARESGGNPTIVEGHGSPFSHASGLWQFMPGTWNDYAGFPYAAAAPASVQNEKAREVWAGGAGCSHWSAC